MPSLGGDVVTVGEMIREKRKACGLSMAALGERIGVTAAAISRYELGQRAMSLDTVQSIANALGVHILDLVGIGEELDKFQVTITDVRPLPGNPQDATPEKIAETVELMNTLGYRGMYDSLSDADKVAFWKSVEQPLRAELDDAFNALNDRGQEIAVERVKELGKIREYRRPDTPPAPPEDTETTPAAPPPESTEDGK